MRGRQYLCTLALAAAFTGSLMFTGCASHHYYRAYDPYHNDYHRWDANEGAYYHQWAVETHRDPNRDYRDIGHDEQKQYWDWRHSNHGGDHQDHDHDHH